MGGSGPRMGRTMALLRTLQLGVLCWRSVAALYMLLVVLVVLLAASLSQQCPHQQPGATDDQQL